MSSTTKKKFVEKELSEDYTLPSVNQIILKIMKPKGNNLHQVLTSTGEEYLASMPAKFRKTIWVKRGDFVVAEEIPEGQKVKFEIVKILQKEQIKYYTSEKVWPQGFCESMIEPTVTNDLTDSEEESNSDEDKKDFVICNPNRQKIRLDCIDSSSDSDS